LSLPAWGGEKLFDDDKSRFFCQTPKEIACGAFVYCDYAMAFRTDSEPKGQSAAKSSRTEATSNNLGCSNVQQQQLQHQRQQQLQRFITKVWSGRRRFPKETNEK